MKESMQKSGWKKSRTKLGRMPRQPQQVEQMARKRRRRRRSKLTNSLEARITRERPPRGRTFKSSSTTLTFQ